MSQMEKLSKAPLVSHKTGHTWLQTQQKKLTSLVGEAESEIYIWNLPAPGEGAEAKGCLFLQLCQSLSSLLLPTTLRSEARAQGKMVSTSSAATQLTKVFKNQLMK